MDRDDHPASLTTAPAFDFARVPAKWRRKVDAWRIVLEQQRCGTLSKIQAAEQLGVTLSTYNRRLAAIREHGMAALVPNYSNCGHTSLPAAFVDHWKTLVEKFQRKTAPAIRELYRQWADRYPIPGYAGHPGWPNLPAGWDKRNLYRYQPSKLELTALRHGLGRAVMKHAPKIFTTRAGMHHLQFLTADDVHLDMKGHILTKREQVRPLQLGFMDVASANRFLWGTKPQMLKDIGKGKEGIGEADFRFLLCSQLVTTGLSRRGTTYLLEHGTATMRDRVIDILNRYYGPHGLICPEAFKIEKSGMLGKAQAICGMGDGRGGKGNPFFKAWLESLHNLIHNELSALPGQIGHDRDEPEHFGVITRENEQLFKLAEKLQPEFRELLKFPTMEYHSQLVPAIDHVLKLINCRTDHQLEGWAACGWMTRSYRLAAESTEWKTEQDLIEMLPPVRSAYLAMAEHDKRCFLPRNLAPEEVFRMRHAAAVQAGEIVPVPLSVISELLYDDVATPERCADGYFEIQDTNIAPEAMLFESRIMRPDGREEELKDRETYEVVLNPFDPSRLYIYSATKARGSFLGTAARVQRLTRGDQQAAEHAFGRNKTRLAELLGDTKRRNTGRTREAASRKTHNADVIERQREFTQRATALLNQSTHADTHTTTTHENRDNEPNW